LPIREGADHAGAPPDLAQDALERVVGADAPPVLLREGIIVPSTKVQLSVSSTAASASSAALVRRKPRSFSITVAEDVAVPVHDAPLPGRLGEAGSMRVIRFG
jgi:hypothetical protein